MRIQNINREKENNKDVTAMATAVESSPLLLVLVLVHSVFITPGVIVLRYKVK